MKKVNLSDYFETVDRLLETSDGQHGLTLCHYPLLSWNHQERTYMVHGHIHADTTMDFWPLIAKRDRVLNAGVDVNNFMPVTFDELVENNKNFKVGSLVGDKGN
jgi:calcineurin-like phosphoesterase family protein